MANLTFTRQGETLTSADLRGWLDRHYAAIAAGVNVGQIQEAKAHAFHLVLIHRETRA